MGWVNGGNDPQPLKRLTPEFTSLFAEGISLVLSRWSALNMYLEQEGDRNSYQKVEHLHREIFSWFTKSKELLCIYDLVDMIEDSLELLFGLIPEESIVEEVAGHLMHIFEECLEGKYNEIERIRKSSGGSRAVRQVDNDESLVAEASDMVVDEPNPKETSETVEAEDGWSVVPTRRNRRLRQ